MKTWDFFLFSVCSVLDFYPLNIPRSVNRDYPGIVEKKRLKMGLPLLYIFLLDLLRHFSKSICKGVSFS
ncbi:MAG: hypothetical protein CSB23_01310 [Deltaproteobacteria bacterium]|nr:MAG: hypothetical protein CSB23_01310 [Deltaproteobacteria bacterium]